MISKNVKNLLLVIIAAAIVVTLILTYRLMNTAEYEEVIENSIGYSIIPNIRNEIQLINNKIYKEEFLTEDKLIINKLIKYIDSFLVLEFNLDDGVTAEFELTNRIEVNGFYGEEQELLFSKERLIHKESLSAVNNTLYRDSHRYSLNKEKTYLSMFSDEAEIFATSIADIIWDLNGFITIDNVKKPITQTFIVRLPLQMEVLKLQKIGFEPIEEEIQTISQVLIPKNKTKLIAYISLVVFLIGIEIILYFLTAKPNINEYTKKINKINREYGDRLTQLSEPLATTYLNIVNVSNIIDLIKISDEIRQPVFFFQLDEEDERKVEYYLLDNNRVYYYVVYDVIKLTADSFFSEVTN